MTRPVPADEIEAIVGASRDRERHIARAASAEQTVYILHPDECAARLMHRPLTECRFSRCLDLGIDLTRWADSMDRPVYVVTNAECRLIPKGDVER